jgi:hypothetical protein
MAGSSEQALMSLIEGVRSPRRRLAVLALLACIVFAQSLLVVHRIDHTSVGHNVSCALCLAADHQAGTLSHTDFVLPSPLCECIVSFADASAGIDLIVAYRSRAPPYTSST